MIAFLMVIPNIVTKFQIFYILEPFLQFLTCRLLTPAAWKVLSCYKKRMTCPLGAAIRDVQIKYIALVFYFKTSSKKPQWGNQFLCAVLPNSSGFVL